MYRQHQSQAPPVATPTPTQPPTSKAEHKPPGSATVPMDEAQAAASDDTSSSSASDLTTEIDDKEMRDIYNSNLPIATKERLVKAIHERLRAVQKSEELQGLLHAKEKELQEFPDTFTNQFKQTLESQYGVKVPEGGLNGLRGGGGNDLDTRGADWKQQRQDKKKSLENLIHGYSNAVQLAKRTTTSQQPRNTRPMQTTAAPGATKVTTTAASKIPATAVRYEGSPGPGFVPMECHPANSQTFHWVHVTRLRIEAECGLGPFAALSKNARTVMGSKNSLPSSLSSHGNAEAATGFRPFTLTESQRKRLGDEGVHIHEGFATVNGVRVLEDAPAIAFQGFGRLYT